MAPHVLLGLSLLLFLVLTHIGGQGQLKVGFYRETCPNAESLVTKAVRKSAASSSNTAAVLLRLHFHDCFVEGCDGSILIDGGESMEKHAFAHQGVGGFDVIENAKRQIEAQCPGVVSCADIVALAARDAVTLMLSISIIEGDRYEYDGQANGPAYEVPTGRRDGRVSNLSLAEDMPDVGDSIKKLKSKFFDKGMTARDLVLLSAAHTIGTTACFFMTTRLYNFVPSGGSDPSIDPNFLPELKSKCPRKGDVNIRIPIDHGSEETFDNQILRNIRDGFAVLESDAKLNDDPDTKSVLESYLDVLIPLFASSFETDFVHSIVKMGGIGVKTGSEGEIRKVCNSFN